MFFAFGMDTGSVQIILSVLFFTAELVLECVYEVNYYLPVMTLFPFNNSRKLELVEGALEGSVVLPGCFLFCLPSLCDIPIPLAMVYEL